MGKVLLSETHLKTEADIIIVAATQIFAAADDVARMKLSETIKR